jgi:hypothetical protein
MKTRIKYRTTETGNYMITAIEGVERTRDLPADYHSKAPCYYASPDGCVVFVFDAEKEAPITLQVGTVLTPANMRYLVDTMRAAGMRLTQLRARATYEVEI